MTDIRYKWISDDDDLIRSLNAIEKNFADVTRETNEAKASARATRAEMRNLGNQMRSAGRSMRTAGRSVGGMRLNIISLNQALELGKRAWGAFIRNAAEARGEAEALDQAVKGTFGSIGQLAENAITAALGFDSMSEAVTALGDEIRDSQSTIGTFVRSALGGIITVTGFVTDSLFSMADGFLAITTAANDAIAAGRLFAAETGAGNVFGAGTSSLEFQAEANRINAAIATLQESPAFVQEATVSGLRGRLGGEGQAVGPLAAQVAQLQTAAALQQRLADERAIEEGGADIIVAEGADTRQAIEQIRADAAAARERTLEGFAAALAALEGDIAAPTFDGDGAGGRGGAAGGGGGFSPFGAIRGLQQRLRLGRAQGQAGIRGGFFEQFEPTDFKAGKQLTETIAKVDELEAAWARLGQSMESSAAQAVQAIGSGFGQLFVSLRDGWQNLGDEIRGILGDTFGSIGQAIDQAAQSALPGIGGFILGNLGLGIFSGIGQLLGFGGSSGAVSPSAASGVRVTPALRPNFLSETTLQQNAGAIFLPRDAGARAVNDVQNMANRRRMIAPSSGI